MRCSVEGEPDLCPLQQTGTYTRRSIEANDTSNNRYDDEVTGYSVERCISYTGNTSAASASGEVNGTDKDRSYSDLTEDSDYTLFTSICYKDMDYPVIEENIEPAEGCPCTRSNLVKGGKLCEHSDDDSKDVTTDISTVCAKKDFMRDEMEDKELPEYVVLGFTGVEDLETIKRGDVNPVYGPNINNSVNNRSVFEFNRRNLQDSEFSEKDEFVKGKDSISNAGPQIPKSHSVNSVNFEGTATPSTSFEFEEDAVHEFTDCDVAHVTCDIIEDGGEDKKRNDSLTEELYCSKSYVEEPENKCAVTKYAANLCEETNTRRLTYNEEEINIESEEILESYVNVVLPTERKGRHFNSDTSEYEGIILENNCKNDENKVEKENNTSLCIVDSVDKGLNWKFEEDKMAKSIVDSFESRFNRSEMSPVLEIPENTDRSFPDFKILNKQDEDLSGNTNDDKNQDQERNESGESLRDICNTTHEEMHRELQSTNKLSSEQNTFSPQTSTTGESNTDCQRCEDSSLETDETIDFQMAIALDIKEEKIGDGQLESMQSLSCTILETGFHRNWTRPEEADDHVKQHENKSYMGEGDNFVMEALCERRTTESTGNFVKRVAGDHKTAPPSCETRIGDAEPTVEVEAVGGKTDETTPKTDCTTVPRIEQLKREAGAGNTKKAADHEDSDQTPLITSEWPPADNSKDTEDREDSGVWTIDTEAEDNLDSDTMRFFKKSPPKPVKEETPPPVSAPAEESIPANGGSTPAETIPSSNNSAEPVITKTVGQEQVPLNTLAQESKKAETAAEERATKQDAVDGGSDSLPAKSQVDFIEDDLISNASSVDIFNIEDELEDFKV
eukprot:XP_014770039.1 PREDICTED: uncharacterized protein LOC106869044 [Octopus bimaculoides]